MDAIVAERLSQSPRTYDIYGFCALTIASEFFPHGDIEDLSVPSGEGYITKEELDDKLHVNPQNNLTAIEKLQIGTQMAEAVVDLHGYKNGVIVHGDIQLSQFLLNEDQTLVKVSEFRYERLRTRCLCFPKIGR